MDYCDMSTNELFNLDLKQTEEKQAQADFERKVKHKMEQDEAEKKERQESDELLRYRFGKMSEKNQNGGSENV